MSASGPGALRIAEVDDRSAPVAARLLHRFFVEVGLPGTEARVLRHFEGLRHDRFHHAALAWRDDAAIGVVTVSTQLSVEFGRVAELGDLYVVPAARRSGVGDALIEHGVQWSQHLGCSELQLTIVAQGAARVALDRLYARHGFGDSGRSVYMRALLR